MNATIRALALAVSLSPYSNDVVHAYHGIANRCCCGCAGKHWRPEDAGFKGVVKKVRAALASHNTESIEFDDGMAFMTVYHETGAGTLKEYQLHFSLAMAAELRSLRDKLALDALSGLNIFGVAS